MLAQAVGVSVISQQESGRGELLPHHHGRPLGLDDLYGPLEDGGEGQQLHLAAPLGGGGHLGAVSLGIKRTREITRTDQRPGYLELSGREGEEGQVLATVCPQLCGSLLP